MTTMAASDVFIHGLRSSVYESCYLSTERLLREVGGNTGNLVFHHAIEKALGIAGSPHVYDWTTPIEILNKLPGLMLIPCANQFGVHQDLGAFANRLQSLSHNIVAVGLGVQAESINRAPVAPDGTIRWVNELAAHKPSTAPNITVRGEFSRRVIFEQTGVETVVLGCPSLLISPDPHLGRAIRGRLNAPPDRVMVLAGHHLWTQLARMEALLTDAVTRSGGQYLLQSDDTMFKLLRDGASSITRAELRAIRDFCRPTATLDEFVAWFRRFAISFFDVSAWLEHTRRFDFAVGTRIHGVVIALQAEIPAVCLCHDSRTLELCQTMRVPHVNLQAGATPVGMEQLFALASEHDWDEFDRNRQSLARQYSQFFEHNGLLPSPHLNALANDDRVQTPSREAYSDAWSHRANTAEPRHRIQQIPGNI